MRILGIYSFNGGEEAVKQKYAKEYEEIKSVISRIDSERFITKVSEEKTNKGEMLYSPVGLNKALMEEFHKFGWQHFKIKCDYPTKFYTDGYTPPQKSKQAPFRDMDFIKNKLGVEVQFGKYSFMVYNVCAKMTIFHNLEVIDVGVEIVPVKELALKMSTGVSYFEQFVWDLENRGVSNIDIPVLILGIGK